MMKLNENCLYRYEAQRYSYCVDPEFEIYSVTGPKIYLVKYSIISETSKGFWVYDIDRKRWVSKTSKKRLAHPTKEEALEAYKQRKMAYVRHCNIRLQRAKEELALVDNNNRLLKIQTKPL